MASSLPSPPPHHTLPYSSLALDQVEALRSSCGQVLVAIEEIQGMINWGGEAGIVGWPSLLSAYQRLMALLSLLNHHMTATSLPPPQANSFGPSGSSKPVLTLAQHAVHPHVSSEPASEAWIQALLSTHAVEAHDLPPSDHQGNAPAHETRRQRALRVCAGLSAIHDWKGRVGVLEPEEDEDEDMFGSDDEKEGKPGEDIESKQKAVKKQEEKVEMAAKEGKEEKERELKRLLGLMTRGS